MQPKWTRSWALWSTCVLALSAGGCPLVADLMAPGLPLVLGFDPASIVAPQGVVIVAFNNTTRYAAEFYAFEAADARDLTKGARNFSAEVPAGKQQNEVLECPVAIIAPGSLGADFQRVTTAVLVGGTADAAVTAAVPYTGPMLQSGNAYNCGDVIEIRLSSTGTVESPTFSVSVRVIRGQ